MAKYKVFISRVEYSSLAVVVEADSSDDAVEKVKEEWEKDEYLYEKTTDYIDDASTDFQCSGLAKESETKYLINIE